MPPPDSPPISPAPDEEPARARLRERLLDLAYDASSYLRRHAQPAVRVSAALLLAASLAACGSSSRPASGGSRTSAVQPLNQEVRTGLPSAPGRYPIVDGTLRPLLDYDAERQSELVPTLRAWTDGGRVPVFLTPGGHRRYREADLRTLLETSPASPSVESLSAALLASHERYELSVFPNGEFFGPPEDAFETSASVYLTGG